MSLTVHIHKRLLDLLEEHRVVVWYDGERVFGDLAANFVAPTCTVIRGEPSRLQARRQADEVVANLNEADQPQRRSGNLLIYLPWARCASDDERVHDLFESFAVIGAAFGHDPAERFQSLARQALPERIAEIDRLFAEGKPTLAMIEGLGQGQRYPLLEEALGTDSVVEATAMLLCRDGAIAKVNGVTGALEELLRLLSADLDFTPPPRVKVLDTIVQHLGRFVLFSEFVFDLRGPLPDTLDKVPRASEASRDRVFALCERMRGSDDTREGYITLASRAELELRLPEIFTDPLVLGVRDTFPFEEHRYLSRLQTLARSGDLAEAHSVVAQRRASVWRHLPERALLWKLAERCVDFLSTAEAWASRVPGPNTTVQQWVESYRSADGLWQVDRHQRLMEQGAAACAENTEVGGLIEVCRKRYLQMAEAAQSRFLESVERDGWPPDGVFRQTQIFDRHVSPILSERGKVAYFLVDSMRYEMGRDLGDALESLGPVSVTAAATVLPTTTPCGMAALLPGADGAFSLVEDGDDVAPAVGGRALRTSAERMNLLRERYGDRVRDVTLDALLSSPQKRLQTTLGGADLIVVRTQDIDALGEGTGLHRARKIMTDVLGELRTATDRLASMGVDNFVFAADHGHVLLPEVAAGDVIRDPPGDWKKSKRRCRLGASRAGASGVVVFPAEKVGIVGPFEELAVPSGFRVFTAGEGYFHEGVSLQECLIPVVVLQVRERAKTGTGGDQVEIRYRADQFTSRVIGLKVWYNALLGHSLTVRIDVCDGPGAKAALVGEAADCDARDPNTRLITLEKGKETQVPIRIQDDFKGSSIEVRAVDPTTGRIFYRLKLRNAVME
jgi:hypothetical protein